MQGKRELYAYLILGNYKSENVDYMVTAAMKLQNATYCKPTEKVEKTKVKRKEDLHVSQEAVLWECCLRQREHQSVST